MQPNYNCDQGTQFPPPAPGLFGYGENHLSPGEVVVIVIVVVVVVVDHLSPGQAAFKWSLMDEVWIPENLETGAYTLSFRYFSHTAESNRTFYELEVHKCELCILFLSKLELPMKF